MGSRIADYAMIGDGRTAALVAKDGAIDWLCWPRFDSDACFAAMLGTAEHGCWRIAPEVGDAVPSRRYRDDTLILETSFVTPDGTARVTDFMPMQTADSAVIRIVEGIDGRTDMVMSFGLRHNYGALAPWMEATADGCVAVAGPDRIALHANTPVRLDAYGASSKFQVVAGERVVFVLVYGLSHQPAAAAPEAAAALRDTEAFWRGWIGQFTQQTEWPEAMRRSLITLKALCYDATGSLVAAPTLGLPEALGGKLNWDYRYCWLRDGAFTIDALLNAGFRQEAEAWRDWALRAVSGPASQMRIMYRVDGARHIPTWEIDWLPGYGGAKPVRVGNAASTQHQGDSYGELLDALHLCAQAGIDHTPHGAQVETDLVTYIMRHWQKPGAGLWESRKEPRNYVYSKVMCWVGLDRFLKGQLAGRAANVALVAEATTIRQRMHDEICARGFNPKLGHFVDYYDGEVIDAALLLLPLVGFLPAQDERIAGTIAAVEAQLMEGGLVRRKKPDGDNPEGTFLACSFWLADCRRLQGREAAARALIERVMAVRNDVGLLSEEYDVREQALVGNFPQALTHLALVNSVLGISGCSLYQRGGG